MRVDPDVPRIVEPVETPRPAERRGGPLVLIGGNCTPNGRAFQTFLELSEARTGAMIVGIAAASAEPAESAKYWTTVCQGCGIKPMIFPPFDRHDPVSDENLASMLRDAAAVFLAGGDQVKLVAALSGTQSCRALKDLHFRGGVVCGTSAGAAAVTELTMAGGELDEEGNLVEQYIGPGLGLLGYEAVVDTHFSQRRRLQRLFLVIAENPQLFGVGIDEDTALVVRGSVGEVVGAGGVTFVDGRDTVHYDNAATLIKGRHLTISHLRVGIVGTSHQLDFRGRDLHEPAVVEAREPQPDARAAMPVGTAAE